MVGRQGLGMGDSARALDLGTQLIGGALLAQPPRGEQLEEHRHEEDGEEGGREHAAHDAGADRAARAGARAGGERERGHALLRIDRAEFLAELNAAATCEMDCGCLVRNFFQVECDADPVGRRRAEISVKLHCVSPRCAPFGVALTY